MKPSRSPAWLWLAALLAAWSVARAAPVDSSVEVQELHKSGKSAEALRRLDALIEQRPTDANLRFQKGVILADQRRTGEAVVVFQRLVDDYPGLPEPMNNLAVLYTEQGQMEKARSMLEAAIRSKPNYGTAFQNLGDVYTRLAARAYSRALQIDDSEGAPKLAMIRSLYEDPASAAAKPASAPAPMVAALTKPSASAPAMAVNKAAPPVAPPTAKPPPATAAASASAAASAPQRAAADEARQVNAAVQAWAMAWSRKDLNAYFAAYAPGFKGTSGSAAAWQTARRDRIVGKSAIRVELSGVTVEMAQGVARVSFSQSYAADQLRVTSQKTLELVKQGDKWVIRKESVG